MAESGWISVKDEMPRGGKECLIVWSGYVQNVLYTRDGIGFNCAGGYQWNGPENLDIDSIPDEEVTHWMYKPVAPPQE